MGEDVERLVEQAEEPAQAAVDVPRDEPADDEAGNAEQDGSGGRRGVFAGRALEPGKFLEHPDQQAAQERVEQEIRRHAEQHRDADARQGFF